MVVLWCLDREDAPSSGSQPYASTRRNAEQRNSKTCTAALPADALSTGLESNDVYEPKRKSEILTAISQQRNPTTCTVASRMKHFNFSEDSEHKEQASPWQEIDDLPSASDYRTEEEPQFGVETADGLEPQGVIDASALETLLTTVLLLPKQSEFFKQSTAICTRLTVCSEPLEAPRLVASSTLNAIDGTHSQSLFNDVPSGLQVPTMTTADSKGNEEKFISNQEINNLPLVQSKGGSIVVEASSAEVEIKENSNLLRNAKTLTPEFQVVHGATGKTARSGPGRRTCWYKSVWVRGACFTAPVFRPSQLLCLMLLLCHSAESSRDPRKTMEKLPTPASVDGSSSSSRNAQSTATAATSSHALRVLTDHVITVAASPGPITSYEVPRDTFNVPLGNLIISVFQWNGSALPHNHLVTYWSSRRTIDVNPGQNDLGTHDLLLRAMRPSNDRDSDGTEVVQACLRVVVKDQHGGVPDPGAGMSQAACHPPPAPANWSPLATVSSLKLKVERGKELRIELPDSLFFDPEDGDTRHLKLQLFTVYGESHSPAVTNASRSSPLQLESAPGKRRQLRALYWQPDSRSTSRQYLLRATDRKGSYADVSVHLNIREPPAPVLVFHTTISVDLSSFVNDVPHQLNFLSCVARVAGDNDTANLWLVEAWQAAQSSTTLSSWQRRSPSDLLQTSKVVVVWTHACLTLAAASVCPMETSQLLTNRFVVNETVTAVATDRKHGLGSYGISFVEVELLSPFDNKPATVEIEKPDSFWSTTGGAVVIFFVTVAAIVIFTIVMIVLFEAYGVHPAPADSHLKRDETERHPLRPLLIKDSENNSTLERSGAAGSAVASCSQQQNGWTL